MMYMIMLVTHVTGQAVHTIMLSSHYTLQAVYISGLGAFYMASICDKHVCHASNSAHHAYGGTGGASAI